MQIIVLGLRSFYACSSFSSATAAIFAALPLAAQITTTVIYGTVTDSTGAVVLKCPRCRFR